MKIIPLVASNVNLSGICELAEGTKAAAGLLNKTDHGRSSEIMKKLCHRDLPLRLTIAVRLDDTFLSDCLRENQRVKVFKLHGSWLAVEADLETWRDLVYVSSNTKTAFLREFFCQVFLVLEMVFPELMLDLIRVPDADGVLFSLNKRY
jgi:hypothetical protein